jgi:hypothetical protein
MLIGLLAVIGCGPSDGGSVPLAQTPPLPKADSTDFTKTNAAPKSQRSPAAARQPARSASKKAVQTIGG